MCEAGSQLSANLDARIGVLARLESGVRAERPCRFNSYRIRHHWKMKPAGRATGSKPAGVLRGLGIKTSVFRHFWSVNPAGSGGCLESRPCRLRHVTRAHHAPPIKIDLTLADPRGLLEEVRDTPAACRSRKAFVLLILQRAVCDGNRTRAKLPWGSGTGLEKCQDKTESRLRILIQRFGLVLGASYASPKRKSRVQLLTFPPILSGRPTARRRSLKPEMLVQSQP